MSQGKSDRVDEDEPINQRGTRRMPSQLFRACGVAAVAALFGCGGASQLVNPLVAPKTDVAGATGRTLARMVEGPDRPLIVDWTPEQRVDLEVAMRQGVAVVQYDGQHLALLPDCVIDGDYRFYGVTQKTELIRLESQAEVQANLPFGGARLISNISGAFDTGSTLDLALVIIGKSRTTWTQPTVSDLKGQCRGATHFVRGAILGAFAVSVGQKSSASTAVEIFGDGVKGATAAGAGVQRRDGMIAACQGADPEGSAPPKQCRALIRLELFPVVKEMQKTSVSPERLVQQCGDGFILTAGKCVVSERILPAQTCSYDALQGCLAVCQSGDGEACFKLAYAHVSGRHGQQVDFDKSYALVTQSCGLGFATGCVLFGDFLTRKGMPKKSLKAYNKACKLGDPNGCFSAGQKYRSGDGAPRDLTRATQRYRRGCDGGAQAACVALAAHYAGGLGIKADQGQSLALNKRACDGNDAAACGQAGMYYEMGVQVAKDLAKANQLYTRACRLDPSTCLRLAILRETAGKATQKTARGAYERACSRPDTPFGALACGSLGRVYGRKGPVAVDQLKSIEPTLVGECREGLSRACGFIGVALSLLGDPRAPEIVAGACGLGDGWACKWAQRAGPQDR